MAGIGAPKGNQYAKGNKGGGRKSAYQELADAIDAYSIFFDVQDQEALERKIQSGKFSLKDRFLLTAMEGDSAVINKAYHKAVPDIIDHQSKGERIVFMPAEIAEKNGVELAHDTHPRAKGDSAEPDEVPGR